MTISWRTPPTTFLDAVELERVSRAQLLLNLESGVAIESYTMSPDGPTVSSVFILSESYICEVRLTTKNFEFDICSAHALLNYRVKFGKLIDLEADASIASQSAPVEVSNDGAKNIGLEEQLNSKNRVSFVEVTLRHTDTLLSTISYFGEDVDDWFKFFLKAYPKEFLLPYSTR